MEPLLLFAVIAAGWVVLSLAIALIVGRIAAAGEHEHRMAELHRSVSDVTPKTTHPGATPGAVSTLPRS